MWSYEEETHNFWLYLWPTYLFQVDPMLNTNRRGRRPSGELLVLILMAKKLNKPWLWSNLKNLIYLAIKRHSHINRNKSLVLFLKLFVDFQPPSPKPFPPTFENYYIKKNLTSPYCGLYLGKVLRGKIPAELFYNLYIT